MAVLWAALLRITNILQTTESLVTYPGIDSLSRHVIHSAAISLMSIIGLEKTARSTASHVNARCECELCVYWVFPDPTTPALPLTDSVVVIGRDGCDVVLGGVEISRRHARIERQAAGHVLTDLGSTNGIFHNGSRVAAAALIEGNIIRIGEWVGVVALRRREPLEEQALTRRAEPKCDDLALSRFFCEQGMLIGPSLAPAMALAKQAAKSQLSIVIEGETGTGKELLARAVSHWSGRSGPFVAVNCAALPESLAEAELFGYRKGAFTGASSSSKGLIRSAEGGVLLLDELPRLPLGMQSKLLRVMEQREVVPLGESRPLPIDVQIVSATQVPLDELVANGSFARDLQMRIEDFVVRLPPLRERREDLGYLLRELVKKHSGASSVGLEATMVEDLCLHQWPGNLRELDRMVRTLVSLHGHEPSLRSAHLPPRFTAHRAPLVERQGAAEQPTIPSSTPTRSPRSSLPTKSQLESIARKCGGNLTRAASLMGIPRQLFYRYFTDQERLELRKATANKDSPGDVVASQLPARSTHGVSSGSKPFWAPVKNEEAECPSRASLDDVGDVDQ